MSSDLILAGQLDSFMRAVPEVFSWEALQSMLEPRISHREYRGAKDSPRFAFALDVLDQGQMAVALVACLRKRNGHAA